MPARHDSERRKTRAREPTGKSRKKAPKGLNLPLQNDVLDVMVTHFEDVYRDVRLHVLPIASAQLLLALPLTGCDGHARRGRVVAGTKTPPSPQAVVHDRGRIVDRKELTSGLPQPLFEGDAVLAVGSIRK